MSKSYSVNQDEKTIWFKEGTRLIHREDGPAIEYFYGRKEWWQNGKRHRIDGPAIERPDGTKCWYQNNELHRLDGPAIEVYDGSKQWYQYGKLHRTDGLAVDYVNGRKNYWLNDICYPDIKTYEEWIIFQILD